MLLISRPLIGALTDRYSIAVVTVPAMGCFALSFFLLAFAQNLALFFLSAFVSAFGYGACQSAFNALCMRLVPPERRGAGSCTCYIGVDAGYLIGPILLVMTLPIFLAALFTMTYLRKSRNKE